MLVHRFYGTSPFQLGPNCTIRRRPPRPAESQQENYYDLYDNQTVWVDVVQSGDDIVFSGPPLENLEAVFTDATYILDGQKIDAKPVFQTLNRAHRGILTGVGPVDHMRVDFGREDSETVRVSRDLTSLTRGRNVIVAMQRNNPVRWMQEWAAFNVLHNQASAAIIYDMRSYICPPAEIIEAMSKVEGLEVLIIVDWPFKYGVKPSKAGDPWDSDYGQYVAWEHCRQRFLQEARAVTIADLDEVFLAEDGRSIFDHAAEAETGVVRFMQRMMTTHVDGELDNSRDVSFSRYRHYDAERATSTPKWAAFVDKLKPTDQYLVHSISGHYEPYTEAILGRQFMSAKLAWGQGSFERLHEDRPAAPGMATDDRIVEAFRAAEKLIRD